MDGCNPAALSPAGGDERKFSLVGAQACNHESDETWGFKYQDEAGQLFQALDRTYRLGRYVERAAAHRLRWSFEGACRGLHCGRNSYAVDLLLVPTIAPAAPANAQQRGRTELAPSWSRRRRRNSA